MKKSAQVFQTVAQVERALLPQILSSIHLSPENGGTGLADDFGRRVVRRSIRRKSAKKRK